MLVNKDLPLMVKLPLSSSLASPLFVKVNVKLLTDVSESVAESVPIMLPIEEFSEILLELKLISVGGGPGKLYRDLNAL